MARLNADGTVTLYCPRCDREKTRSTLVDAWVVLKKHVLESHPEYDVDWHGEDD